MIARNLLTATASLAAAVLVLAGSRDPRQAQQDVMLVPVSSRPASDVACAVLAENLPVRPAPSRDGAGPEPASAIVDTVIADEAVDAATTLATLAPETALGHRLRNRLALLDEPDDEEYEHWYAGTQLDDLSRHVHDVRTAQAWFGAAASQPALEQAIDAEGLGFLRGSMESFEAENTWLAKRVEFLVNTPPSPTRTRYAAFGDEALATTFRTPRDRYALKVQLRAELAQGVEDAAAAGFAEARGRLERGEPQRGLVLL